MHSFVTFTSLALAATATIACPTSDADMAQVSDTPNTGDIPILQFALTLEHLQNAFYNDGLSKYDGAAFTEAGLPSWVRNRFVQIAKHEASHVATLQTALGDQAVPPCEYSFPYYDPASFVTLSMILENVGVAAYLGATSSITDPTHLSVLASVLSSESRHAAWVSSAVGKQSAWNQALDIGLGISQISSIAAAFISSCPTTDTTLMVKSFPPLRVDSCTYAPGSTIDLDFDDTPANGQPLRLAIYSGLTPTFVDLCDKQATLPVDLAGMAYGIVTTALDAVTDATTIAGPVIMYFPD
ncbi:hypothetical protein FRB99_001177 [Tulasnella sp. 403]|nr:hypothetical protein FRB99_001177 [Tulasnella sp. 403]